MASWFEAWFDSPLHEYLYAHRDAADAARLADLIESCTSEQDYPELLDLACGRGRHSLNFAKKGYRVTGVDLAPAAIAKAKNKAFEAGLDIRFLEGDMREPLPETFDIIVNLFTSFGYFEDDSENERAITAVSKMLRPGGVFWLDYLNPVKLRTSLVARDQGEIPGWSYSIRRWIDDGAVHKEIRLFKADGTESQVFEEYVRLFDLEWFTVVAQRHGLGLQKAYGDYDGTDFDPAQSDRMVLWFIKS